MSMYCDLAAVERALQMSLDDTTKPTAADVEEFIKDASADLDSWSGRAWGMQTINHEYHDGIDSGPRAGQIQLKYAPIIQVISIEYWDGGVWNSKTQEATDGQETPPNYGYVVNYDSGLIYFHHLRLMGPRRFRVTYRWGYEEIPRDVGSVTADMAALYALVSLSGKAQRQFNMNGMTVSYAGGWRYGQQALMLQMRINRRLGRLRQFVVGTG